MRKAVIKGALAAALLAMATPSCTTLQKNPGLYSAMGTGIEALTLTNDQVIGYVKQSIQQMDAQNQVAPADSKYTKRLNNLVGGLTHVGDIPLNFKVYLTNEVNAFACPDGSVRVYSGIMDLMDDDELLGIIGHEIGHVAMEHSKNAFKQELLNNALLQAVGSTGTRAAQLTSGQLAALAKTYVGAKFSRKQENEADEFAYGFLKAAGKNPYSIVMAFEKMQALEKTNAGQQSSYIQNMFSSHPETQERINRITALCQQDGFKRPAKK